MPHPQNYGSHGGRSVIRFLFRALLVGLVVVLSMFAGWIDEHLFLLAAMPFALGVVCKGVLSRWCPGPVSHGLIASFALASLLCFWLGRYIGAEAIYLQGYAMMNGTTLDSGAEPFHDFLMGEVGKGGILGFLELRSLTGIRVVGGRGLDWGVWGFSLQFLFEAGVLLSCSGMALRGVEGDLDTEQFENQAE